MCKQNIDIEPFAFPIDVFSIFCLLSVTYLACVHTTITQQGTTLLISVYTYIQLLYLI